MEEIWLDWNYLQKNLQNKKVILWGRSEDWVHKTMQELNDIKIELIVDSNPKYNNTTYFELPVIEPSNIPYNNNDLFIIITGGTYESIIESIKKYGYTNYCCSPVFKDWSILHEIKSYNQNLLITSSDYDLKNQKESYNQSGGGLYTFNTLTHSLEKKVSGSFRQIIEVDGYYYIVAFSEKLIYKIDKADYNVIKKYPIDQSEDQIQKPNACGIAYHSLKKLFFIANAGDDTINIYEKKDFKHINTIHISQKTFSEGGGLHHITDLAIVENHLLVSCFSISGNWRKDFMDGGILEYDLNNLSKAPNILCNTLWKPHSVEYIDNKICYIDSMRGNLWIGNQKISGTFQGFARGLCYDDRFYYIAQSEVMYLKDVIDIRNNTILNSGVYLFDSEKKVSKFYSFPNLSNIYDIIVMK